jgi:hypothetical protein
VLSKENAELDDRNGELLPIMVRGLNGGESVVNADEPLLLSSDIAMLQARAFCVCGGPRCCVLCCCSALDEKA